jgi:hypothetical protein
VTIRVFNEGYRDQYDRMKRSRARLDGPYQRSVDYEDDFYHAVQDAWHLKDWVKNDAAVVDEAYRKRIAEEAEKILELRIIQDLANCTKHLVLRVTVDGEPEHAALNRTDSEVNLGSKRMHRTIWVRLKGGSERKGADLLDDAHRAWEHLTGHGLLP